MISLQMMKRVVPQSRVGLLRGVENRFLFSAATVWIAFADARRAAIVYAGLDSMQTVPFVQELGPFRGTKISGSQSVDGLRGWRLDLDQRLDQLHVNWWDYSDDPQRTNRLK